MRRIWSAMTAVPLDVLRQALEAEGIACVVKGRALSMTAGEVPPIETWPSLWVLDDTRAAEAERLVAAVLRDDAPRARWTCPVCGTKIDGHFAACWRCARPEGTAGREDPVVAETARDFARLGERTRPLWQALWVAGLLAAGALALRILAGL